MPEILKQKIRTIPNFPKEGIMFRDITTLLQDAKGFARTVNLLVERYMGVKIDKIVGIESRGFILGGALAKELGVGFVPIRKAGKLPFETESVEYQLEYGTDKMEIHKDAVLPGQRVLLVDDLLATGGTMLAAAQLIERLGGEIIECTIIVDLPELGGKSKLEEKYKVFNLVEFEGE